MVTAAAAAALAYVDGKYVFGEEIFGVRVGYGVAYDE